MAVNYHLFPAGRSTAKVTNLFAVSVCYGLLLLLYFTLRLVPDTTMIGHTTRNTRDRSITHSLQR